MSTENPEDLTKKKLELDIKKAELEIKRLNSRWDYWIIKTIPLITAGIAVAGFFFSINQFNAQQREAQTWKKAEFLAVTAKEFDANPSVINAKQMLDSLVLYPEGRSIKLFPGKQETQVMPVDIYFALETDKSKLPQDRDKLNTWIAISDCFDVFLSNLEQFNRYIETQLVTKDEVRLDIIYWIELIGDHNIQLHQPKSELLRGKPDEGEQSVIRKRLLEYADRFKFDGVKRLLAKYGYGPQQDTRAASPHPAAVTQRWPFKSY